MIHDRRDTFGGYFEDFIYCCDAPLMIIGESANEIQQLLIARRLLERYVI